MVQCDTSTTGAPNEESSDLFHRSVSHRVRYCEACDDKSGRRDAEARESELMSANRALLAEIAEMNGKTVRRAEITLEELEWLKHPQSANDLADFVYEFAARNVATQPLEQKPVAWANADELDNMLDDRTATVAGAQSGLRRVALYLGPQPEQVAQDREDAEKYRWLLAWGDSLYVEWRHNCAHGTELDETIRAARASGKGGDNHG